MNPKMIKHGYKLISLAAFLVLIALVFWYSAGPFIIGAAILLVFFGLYYIFKGRRVSYVPARDPSSYVFSITFLQVAGVALIITLAISLAAILDDDTSNIIFLAAVPFIIVIPIALFISAISFLFIRRKHKKLRHR